MRFTDKQRVLVIANFDRNQALQTTIQLPAEILDMLPESGKKGVTLKNLLTGSSFYITDLQAGIPVNVLSSDAWLLAF